METKACQELEKRVIKNHLCTLCGGCVGRCPYIVTHQGKVILKDVCDLTEGRCYDSCPMASLDLDQLHREMFGTSYLWNELGTVEEVLIARSTDMSIRAKAQYGGIVTGLICFALEEGMIDGAVLTHSQNKSEPWGVMASTREEVLGCSGSTYVATPILETLNRGTREDHRKRIGVVGTPCQVLTLAKMRASRSGTGDDADRLGPVIGLFCTWALSWDGFSSFLSKRVPVKDVTKVDIPPPPANVFEIYTSSRRITIPLDEVRSLVRGACGYCLDMTSEFADLSVGAAEGIDGWNTVIIRSDRGKELVERARAKGVIEIGTLPEKNLDHLKESSLLKKKRALKKIVERSGHKEDGLHLKLRPEVVQSLIEE